LKISTAQKPTPAEDEGLWFRNARFVLRRGREIPIIRKKEMKQGAREGKRNGKRGERRDDKAALTSVQSNRVSWLEISKEYLMISKAREQLQMKRKRIPKKLLKSVNLVAFSEKQLVYEKSNLKTFRPWNRRSEDDLQASFEDNLDEEILVGLSKY